MDYIKIATVNDFAIKHIKSYNLLGKYIGIIRKENGEFFATEVGCKHQRADLTKGKLDGMIATCPRHGWKYNLETGKCINHESAELRRYPLKVENGNIYILLHAADGSREQNSCIFG